MQRPCLAPQFLTHTSARYCPKLPDMAIDVRYLALTWTDSTLDPKSHVDSGDDSERFHCVSDKNVKLIYTQHSYFQITDEDAK